MTREEAKGFLIDISYTLGSIAVEFLTEKDAEKMREAIEVLEQEPKTDTWSIKDVADTLAKHGLIVEQEPSAQPEIIRCKDCKYWRGHKYAKETKRYIPFCGFNAIYTKSDDFCSRAERRENDKR